MKAVTICQPWAFAILHANKRVENRSWPTAYRGPLLIHAGTSRRWFDRDSVDLVSLASGRIATPDAPGMHFGAIVGRCDLVGCEHVDRLVRGPHLGDERFIAGTWCWILADVEAFDCPLPWRGERGLFEVEWYSRIAHVYESCSASQLRGDGEEADRA